MIGNKRKSLGVIKWPKIEVSSFNGHSGLTVLKIFNGDKIVKVECNSYYLARQLTDSARVIAKYHREYTQLERQTYLNLKKYTGYVPEDGEE